MTPDDTSLGAQPFGQRRLEEARQALVLTLVDAHELSGLAAVPTSQLTDSFGCFWPELSLPELIRGLVREGQLEQTGSAASGSLRLAGWDSQEHSLREWLLCRTLHLAHESPTVAEVIETFVASLRGDLPVPPLIETGPVPGDTVIMASGRIHHLLFRPAPLLLPSHPTDFILVVAPAPDRWVAMIADRFVEDRDLRTRTGVMDVERAISVNLSRSELVVHFDRFLRRQYRVRTTPDKRFAQLLFAAGILNLNMG